MTIKKVDSPIVCDTLGCGKIADRRLTFKTGHVICLCPKCYTELADALKKEKSNVEKPDR